MRIGIGPAMPFPLDLGSGVTLAPVEEADAEPLYATVDAERARLREWLPWVDATRSVDDTLAFVRDARERHARDDGVTLAVRADGVVRGIVALHGVDQRDRATAIGYWLARDAEGRGVMTRATAALVDHSFRELGLHRVEIRCATGNARSRAVPTRLGFREEGVLRDAQWVSGRFVDLVVYGMLQHEWRR